MLRKLMRAKIHRARITQRDPGYIGSITIDEDLLSQSDLRPNEAVLVLDIDNAARFEMYVIRGEPGSGTIGINGAAAKLVEIGHRIIILGFGYLATDDIDNHVANVVVCNEDNRVVRRLQYPSMIGQPVKRKPASTHHGGLVAARPTDATHLALRQYTIEAAMPMIAA